MRENDIDIYEENQSNEKDNKIDSHKVSHSNSVVDYVTNKEVNIAGIVLYYDYVLDDNGINNVKDDLYVDLKEVIGVNGVNLDYLRCFGKIDFLEDNNIIELTRKQEEESNNTIKDCWVIAYVFVSKTVVVNKQKVITKVDGVCKDVDSESHI